MEHAYSKEYYKEYIQKCIFCEKPSETSIGLGRYGRDFGVCKKCLKTKTIDELLKRAERITAV